MILHDAVHNPDVSMGDLSKIAAEADELIDSLHAHLETLRQLSDSEGSFDEATTAIRRIRKFKEKTQ